MMKRIPSPVGRVALVLALFASSLAVLSATTPAAHASDIGSCTSCSPLPRIHVLQPYPSSAPGLLEVWGSGFTPGSTVGISIEQVLNLSQGLIAPVQYLSVTANYYGQIDTWTYVDPTVFCNFWGMPFSSLGYTGGLVIFAQDGTTGHFSNNVSASIC